MNLLTPEEERKVLLLAWELPGENPEPIRGGDLALPVMEGPETPDLTCTLPKETSSPEGLGTQSCSLIHQKRMDFEHKEDLLRLLLSYRSRHVGVRRY